jgi:RHH-type rel operon transcriptional repressor/antitoxin RelB
VLLCIQMSSTTTEILSIRLPGEVKARLTKLAQRSGRSKSFLAAEAIAAYVKAEEGQLKEAAKGKKKAGSKPGV